MSGRVESSWPNFTNVGPSSSSISRRCRPRAVPSPAAIVCRRPSTSVAEAVPDGDLGDLAQASDIPLLRPRGHALSVACHERHPSAASPLLDVRLIVARQAPLRRLDVDRLADLLAEQRRAERRGRRHRAGAADSADLDRQLLAAVALDVDDRADADLVGRRPARRSRRRRAARAACGCAPRAGPARSSRRGTRSSPRGRRTRAPS